MNFHSYFKDKKITVMGLGLLGRGVGDVEFLAEQGAILTVTDLKTETELKESLDRLKQYKNIKFVLGEHRMEDFMDCDIVLKSAGVPLDSPFIAEARENNILVEMSTSLFAELSPATIIGVTGTRGKSTVATMIYEVLKFANKKIFLGGNIKGVSTLAHLPESSEDEIVVLELDSWQLQGFGEAGISPHISVFTTFYPDHLNYYKNDLDLYLEDKSNIFKFQDEDDFLILGEQVSATILSKYEKQINSRILIAEPKNWNLKIPGEHNQHNASCAAKATEALEIDNKVIKGALESFSGLTGRLQFMREVNGVKIYNDNNSTTPEATLVALKSLASSKNEKNIILIIGGSDKNLDFNELLEAISMFCKAVILLPGTGTEKLLALSFKLLGEDFKKLTAKSYKLKAMEMYEAGTLQESVQKAMELAKSGDTVLFSPAFASFGPPPGGFKNEFDRGDQFVQIISSL